MLIVQRRDQDVHLYDDDIPDFFDASIAPAQIETPGYFQVVIHVATSSNTMDSMFGVSSNQNKKEIRHLAPNILDAARVVISEYTLHRALFSGEEEQAIDADYWLDMLDGGNRYVRYGIPYDEDDDDDDDDDDNGDGDGDWGHALDALSTMEIQNASGR